MRRLATLQAMDRLGAGLRLAAEDLALRGGGDLAGEAQSGHDRLIGPALAAELLRRALRAAHGEPPEDAPVELQVEDGGSLPASYVPEAGVESIELAGVDHMAHLDPTSDAWQHAAAWLTTHLDAPAEDT